MKKVGNINNIPIVLGRNNEIKNQIKAEINIDGTLSFKKRNSLGELTPLTYINILGNNAKSRRKVGELFNKSLISSPTHLLKKEEILVLKSNEGIILGIKVNNGIKIISKNDFFTITALASGDIQISIPGNVILLSLDGKEFIPFKSISYSKDLINWKTEYPKSTIRGKEFDGYRTINIPVNKGDKVYLKGDALCWYTNCNGTSTRSSNNNLHIASTAKFSISGNILSLFYEDNFRNYNTFPKIPSGEYGSYNPRHFPFVFFGSTFLYDARELELPNDAPELCYYGTFLGCTSLKFPMKSLPALSPKMMAYTSMFLESGIVETPEILAEEVEASTFKLTFYNCKFLTKCTSSLKPKLLYSLSYNQMFKGCTSLIEAPEIQATHHDASGNYHMGLMFSGCTSLTSSPSLKILTLGKQGYYQLFYGCKNLNKIEMLATDVSATGCLSSWVNGVASVGIFIKSSTATWDITGVDGIPSGWIIKNLDGPYPQSAYLCFTSTGDSTVAMMQIGTPNTSANKVIQYKLNNGRWQTWDLSAVTLADGDKMYVKSADEIPISETESICKIFVMTGSIAASGNTMSLLNFTDTLPDYAFCNMFNSCTSLTTTPDLPATKLTTACYAGMFMDCTSLTQAPALPAITLTPYCYTSMFSGCTSLTSAPELPATTLELSCYDNMFNNCSKLNYVKAMFTTDLTTDTYITDWLLDVSPTGTFVKNSAATWTNEDAGIPTGWTVVDNIDNQRDYLTLSALEDGEITITISSDLGSARATSLSYSKDKLVWKKTNIDGRNHTIKIPVSRGDNVYFKGKAKQWYNPSGPGGASIDSTANINVSGNIMSLLYEDNFEDKTVFPDNSQYTFGMLFFNNKHLCSAKKLILPATTLVVGCYRFMFNGCTSLTTAPALPATKLVEYCYWGMFSGCTSLNSITMLATDISASNCLNDWVSGVATTGTFTKAASMTSLPSGVSGIPTGWTVQTA